MLVSLYSIIICDQHVNISKLILISEKTWLSCTARNWDSKVVQIQPSEFWKFHIIWVGCYRFWKFNHHNWPFVFLFIQLKHICAEFFMFAFPSMVVNKKPIIWSTEESYEELWLFSKSVGQLNKPNLSEQNKVEVETGLKMKLLLTLATFIILLQSLHLHFANNT